MRTDDLVSTFDAVLTILSGPSPLRTAVRRVWRLYLIGLDPLSLPVAHRGRFAALHERMAGLDDEPLTTDEAIRWTKWFAAVAFELRAVRRSADSVRATRHPPPLPDLSSRRPR